MDITEVADSLLLELIRRTMGCFSCCFRTRDHHSPTRINRVSQTITAIPKEAVDPRASNCLWSVLVSEEDSDISQLQDGKFGATGSPESYDRFRAEAEFLKACGTLPQTPAEIRNLEKSKNSQPPNGESEPAFHSWLPTTSTEMFLEKQQDQLQTPIKLFEKWENGSDSSSLSSNSLKNTDRTYTSSSEGSGAGHVVKDTQSLNSSDSHTPIVPSTQLKTKSVHFENQSDVYSSSSRSLSPRITKKPLKQSESPFELSVSKPSPYPTPLKLTDDMQTPGTVFPSYVNNNESGKNPRVRFQYVYSGINPKNVSLFDAPIEEEECLEQADKESPQSQAKFQPSTSEKESNVCPTLSSWLPPKSNNEDSNDLIPVSISQGLLDFSQTPGDKLELGVVDANWNDEEEYFTPQLCNFNGIPNTTTKYKEDQKVNWHATPFEQRLEKALLEDNVIPKSSSRKQLEDTPPTEL